MNDSVQYKKQCEIRWFLRYSAKQSGNGASYLELVAEHRGQPAADAFRNGSMGKREQGKAGRVELTDKRIFRLVHAQARALALESVKTAPEGYIVTIQEPTRTLDQNAALNDDFY